MKVGWSVMQNGTDRSSSKVRNSSILINNVLCGRLDSENSFNKSVPQGNDCQFELDPSGSVGKQSHQAIAAQTNLSS